MAMLGKTLTVYLGADTSKLRSGVNSADRTLSGFGKNLSNMVGPAMIGAAAAAGALAVAVGIEGVQAAMADEAAMSKLNKTLDNLGFDAVSEDVQNFVDKTQLATGVSDDQLRPSLNRLLLATNDVALAQNSLTLALDIAAGTGRTVEQVSNSLGKAFEGNVGALAKLGVGMDAATLKSMSMSEITTALSTKFAGQAAEAADTYQGKMNRLSVAVDEAKETIGYALLNALDDVVASMGGVNGLQGVIDETARGFAYLIEDVATLISLFGNLSPATDNTNKSFLETSTFLSKLATVIPIAGTYLNAWINSNEYAYQQNLATAGTVENLTNKYLELANSIQLAGTAISTADVFSAALGGTPTGGYTAKYENDMSRLILSLRKLKDENNNASRATGGLTSATKEMPPVLRKQIDLVKELTTKVDDAGKALETARNEMNSWISSMASNITSGINLGAAFDSMFYQTGEKAGELNGQSLLDGFNKQIEQAGLFGNYLKRLNSEGGPELRDAVAALGPEAGNKLAEEIIKNGLIPTMQSKLVDVQSMAETTAAEMVPPMLVAGVASAAGYLLRMQTELEASSSLLEEMGRKMGKTLSDAMVEEIQKALAAAGVAQTGAANVMAGRPVDALSIQAEVAQRIDNPFMNATAIMQAIQTAIQQSNARLGYTGQNLNA